MRFEELNTLNQAQVEALYLRDLAIQRVTTSIGRCLLYAVNLPYAPFKGFYLPAPSVPRHLQSSPHTDSTFTEEWITISRGIDVPVVGMTVIGFSKPFVEKPHGQIIYDFSRNSVKVSFYSEKYRIKDSNDPAVKAMLDTLSHAVEATH